MNKRKSSYTKTCILYNYELENSLSMLAVDYNGIFVYSNHATKGNNMEIMPDTSIIDYIECQGKDIKPKTLMKILSLIRKMLGTGKFHNACGEICPLRGGSALTALYRMILIKLMMRDEMEPKEAMNMHNRLDKFTHIVGTRKPLSEYLTLLLK